MPTFQATIRLGGKAATGIPVPEDVVLSLGAGKRPKVNVRLRGHHYRSTIAPMGGEYFIPLSADHRAAAGVAAGDTVEIDIELDTKPRDLEIPSDFSAALAQNASAKQTFEGLSYSQKQRYVLPIEQAKTPETRQRRIEKAIDALSNGNG